MRTQRELEWARFHAIVHFRGSPMQIPIMNVFRRKPRFTERFSNRTRGFFRRLAHTHPMESLTGGRVPGNLSVNASAAGMSVVVVFQDEHPGTFGQNEAI